MYSADNDLLPGEKPLWSGSPKRRRFFGRQDLLALPVLVFWLIGAFVNIFGSAPAGKPTQSISIFFVIFALGFCFFAFGLPLLRYLRLGRTTYLVTNRRVVARTSFLGGKEQSEYLTALSPPVVRPAADGTGTITFGGLSLGALLMAGHGLRTTNAQPKPSILLVGIEDPVRVRDLIATCTEAARRHSTT